MGNFIIAQVVITDPDTLSSGAFANAIAPGESLLIQRAPDGKVRGVYNYSGGAQPVPELVLDAPNGSTAETQAIALIKTMRDVRFP
jgi:hypothetical protein